MLVKVVFVKRFTISKGEFMRLLELTSDTVFKAFMMSERTINYKSRKWNEGSS